MCRCRLGSTAAGTRHFRRAAPRSAGKVGSVQLLRSLTRDPGHYGGDPAKTPLWTIFYETLIHDFDTDHFVHAYTAQLASFVEATRSGTVTGPTGKDARNALAIALAGIQSVSEGRTFKLAHV